MPESSPLSRFLNWEKTNPDDVFLRQAAGKSWKSYTWSQAGNIARRLAAGLQAMGVRPGDHVAILSKNCPEWVISDLAIMMAGCVSIPIYPTLSAASIQPILAHSDSRAIFIGKLDDYSRQEGGIPDGILRIGMEAYGIAEMYSLEKLVSDHEPLGSLKEWRSEEILTIIYTSGTTGKSKGVMHAVKAFETVIPLVRKTLDMPDRPRLFSYLPMSHIAERMAIELLSLYAGGMISFAESIDRFLDNLKDTQPQLFFAVPRIWGKLQEGILKKLPQKKLDFLLSLPLVSTLLKKGLRRKLGLGKATHIYSSAAPLAPELQQWWLRLGIPLRQAYGMTEDCVYSHFDLACEFRVGKVGRALPGLQVRFSEAGELLEKSPSNMIGYYKETGLTAEAFTEDHFLKTGDIGEYDADGFLTITGRVKDQFKTDKGKYIAPSPIEMQLLAHEKIEQACVVGTGVPQPIAMITLTEAGKKTGMADLSNELIPFVKSLNSKLEVFEKLEKLVILEESWTTDNGLLTPTLKVKRNELEKMHLPKYPLWYQEKEMIVWAK